MYYIWLLVDHNTYYISCLWLPSSIKFSGATHILEVFSFRNQGRIDYKVAVYAEPRVSSEDRDLLSASCHFGQNLVKGMLD